MEQFGVVRPIAVERGEEAFGRYGLFVIDVFFHRRQSVRGRCDPAAVQTEIVVFLGIAEQVHEGGWQEPNIFDRCHLALAFRLDRLFHGLEQSFKVPARRQVCAQHFIDQFREVDRADVGNVVADLRDDEFPAGGDHVVDRVLVVIAEFLQTFDHNVVVGILREAEPDFGQFGSFLIEFERGIFVDTEIDFGVDEFEIARRKQAKFGKFVESIASVGKSTAEYHALSVVALLNANVEVAVLVEGEKEIFHEFECGFLRVNARVHIFLEVGVHILVETTHGVVVVAFEPEGEMQDAEKLKRLAKIAGRVTRDLGKDGNKIIPTHAGGLVAIAVAKPDDRVDHANL